MPSPVFMRGPFLFDCFARGFARRAAQGGLERRWGDTHQAIQAGTGATQQLKKLAGELDFATIPDTFAVLEVSQILIFLRTWS